MSTYAKTKKVNIRYDETDRSKVYVLVKLNQTGGKKLLCFTQMTLCASKSWPMLWHTSMLTFSNIHYFSFILFLSKHMIHINMYCIYRIGSPRLYLLSLFQVNRFTVPFLVQLQILVYDNYTLILHNNITLRFRCCRRCSDWNTLLSF